MLTFSISPPCPYSTTTPTPTKGRYYVSTPRASFSGPLWAERLKGAQHCIPLSHPAIQSPLQKTTRLPTTPTGSSAFSNMHAALPELHCSHSFSTTQRESSTLVYNLLCKNPNLSVHRTSFDVTVDARQHVGISREAVSAARGHFDVDQWISSTPVTGVTGLASASLLVTLSSLLACPASHNPDPVKAPASPQPSASE